VAPSFWEELSFVWKYVAENRSNHIQVLRSHSAIHDPEENAHC
jgi:hypothetical protein